MRKNAVKEKSFEFALRIIQLYKFLVDEKKEFIMSKQLLRSGTAIGAMVRESEYAESKADFIHKLSIGLKEANETEYWLELLFKSGYIDEAQFISTSSDIIEIQRLLISIIKTSKHAHK
jgi:four helix bundle protein